VGSRDNREDHEKKEAIQRSGRPQIQEPGREPIARQRFEEILGNSKSFLNSIINKSSYPMWIADDQGTLVWLNQACRDLLRLTDAEVVGKYNIFQDNIVEAQGLLPLVRRVFEEGETVRFEIKYDTSQLNKLQFQHTTFVILDVTMFPIMDEKGRITHAVIQHMDITERKRAEENLNKEKLLTEAILDSLPGTFFLIDSQGRNLRTNTSGMVVSGYSWEEISRMHALEFIAEEDRPAAQRALEEVFAQGEASVEAQMLTKDGRKIPFLFTGRKFIFDHTPCILGTGLEIKERKLAEEVLRKSEKKYRSLYLEFQAMVNAIPDVLCLLSPDLKIVWSNEATVVATLQRSAADLMGKYCYAVRHDRSEPCENCPVLRCFRSGKVEIEEDEAGGSIWELRAVPVYDDHGEVLGAIEVGRNITERKQMEEALRESQALYQDLVETAQDLIWQCDSEGRYTYLNPAWEEVFGYEIEEMLGKRFADFQPPEYADRDLQEFSRVLEGNIVKGLETVHLAKDGRELHLVFNAKFVRDQDGRITGTRGTAYNITERKQAEQSLRQSEARFRQIVESSPLPLGMATAEGMIEYLNPKFVETFGYSLEEIPQLEDWFRLAYPDPAYRQRVVSRWQKASERITRERSTTETLEVEVTCKDGSKRIMEIFGSRMGKKTLVVFNDLTERKRMEEVLEKRLVALSRPLDDAVDINFHDLFSLEDIQRIQDLFANSTGVASLITTPDGTPITRPSNFCRLCSSFVRQTEHGRKKCSISDAALGRYNPDGPTVENCLSAGLCNAGASITLGGKHIANWLIGQVRDETQTEENIRKYARELGVDAEEFIAAFREVPVMSADQFKQVAQALFIFANQLSATAYQNVQQARFITEHKRMEEALRNSEQRLSEIIDFLPDATFAIDLEGKVIAWNRAIEEMTGVQAEDIIGKGDYEYTVPFYGMRRPALIDLVFMSDEEIEKKYVFVKKEGDIFLAEAEVYLKGGTQAVWAKARPLYDSEGNISGAIEAIRDITEHRRAEAERGKLEARMREVQKLESLGVLAGGIAHDFNNLLMAILGNADLALFSLSPASPARPHVEEIALASQRAADLCRQMLAYSGKGRFVVGRYDLSEIVREMAQMLEVSISKKASLQYSFGSELPPVEADATQLRQVIMNLITNASEALGDRSGVISVSTGVMDCDRAYLSESHLDENLPEGRYVYLEVSDTGGGMDEETRRRLFDPFFTTKFTGRGLGLAAVLGIVRGHRGAIKVYSEPGKGTNFKILLPAVAWTPADRAPSTVKDAPLPHGGTVLLVDDDPDVRQVGAQMLKRLGFKVLTAAHGQEALEVIRTGEGGIDCVILDLTMPEMGGDEVFREIRRLRSDVCVILSSGYNEQDVTERFVGKGLAGFIQKPYSMANLRVTLNRVLGRK